MGWLLRIQDLGQTGKSDPGFRIPASGWVLIPNSLPKAQKVSDLTGAVMNPAV